MSQSVEEKRRTVSRLVAERAKRSPMEQLRLLDQRLGKGQGAAKERLRLQDLIDNKKVAPAIAPVVQETPEQIRERREARKAEKKARKRAERDDE
jgi:hypothetical protein